MKGFRNNEYIQIVFTDGTVTEKFCNDNEEAAKLWEFLADPSNDEAAIKQFFGVDKYSGKELMEAVKHSNILTLRGASVYMEDVSELSIPQDFVEKILEAEENEDEATIKKYRNFWTLVSLNPDSRVRNNLFWFIRKWDMQITDSGLIKAYRNAVLKSTNNLSNDEVKDIINTYYITKYVEKGNPDTIAYRAGNTTKHLTTWYEEIVNSSEESPVYTDMHSHTTEIRLGQPVKLDRELCDANQEHSCSAGLHVGAKGWLKSNYYGDVGLMVLVNPANVVAVPTIDEYGKMRTCEYFPVAIVDFDDNGDVIEPPYDVHSDVDYLKHTMYEGNINNTDVDNYEIQNTGLSREDMYSSILQRLNDD